MNCRPGCGACCIAPSISSAIPGTPGTARAAGMPHGKPAGVRCVQLDDANLCLIFGQPDRPAVCSGLGASADMCGDVGESDATRSAHALLYLARLERLTTP
jgi:uncharacterized protein